MIAPTKETYAFHILSYGLNPQEQRIIQSIVSQSNGMVTTSKDEIDFCRLAREFKINVILIGQSEAVPEPSYLIWLLRGITQNSRLILLYDAISEQEAERLKRNDAAIVLQRPVQPETIAQYIDVVLTSSHEPHAGFWNRWVRLNPFRKTAHV